jgi:hypothetical protein
LLIDQVDLGAAALYAAQAKQESSPSRQLPQTTVKTNHNNNQLIEDLFR